MNKHNLSLIRLCEILDDKKKHRVLRFWTPEFIYKYAYDKLMKEFNEMFGDEDNETLFDDTIILHDIFNEAYNLIPIIVDNLSAGESPEGMFEMIRDNYGFHEMDVYQMIEAFRLEQKRLIERYKELVKQKEAKPVETKKYTFADVIARTESNLDGTSISARMSMYMFHAKYKLSVKKVDEFNKLKDKSNA